MIEAKKELKDYLHLYLGAPVMSVSMGVTCPLKDITQSTYDLFENGNWKLCLRQLSSMTEKENKESSKVWFNECEKRNIVDIHVYAVMSNWFRKKEFDIDGLIESGLAISQP